MSLRLGCQRVTPYTEGKVATYSEVVKAAGLERVRQNSERGKDEAWTQLRRRGVDLRAE